MIADDPQNLIERYLSGAMSSSETRSFHARVAGDAELRRLLDADRVITGAIARDRAATIPGATVPGEGLMAALEMSRGIARPVAGSWMSLRVAAIGVALGLAGLVAGSFFIAPLVAPSGDRVPAVTAPAVTAPRTGAPAAPPASATHRGASTDASGTPATESGAVDARVSGSSAAAATTERMRNRATDATARSSAHDGAQRPSSASREGAAARSGAIDERSPESLPQVDDTSLKLKVDLEKAKTKP